MTEPTHPPQASQGSVATALAHAERLLRTRPDLALAQSREILALLPTHPAARLIMGRALTLLGEHDDALGVLEALCAEQSRSAASALALGELYAALGREGEAVTALRRAVALKPDLAPAWHALARLLRGMGDETGADAADLAGIRAATHDPGLLAAAEALGAGRLAEAAEALRMRPAADIAAQRMLAEALARMGRLEEAEAKLTALLTQAPGFVAARELLARVLQARSRIADALAQALALRAAEPHNPSFAMLEGALRARLGEHEAAASLYHAVLARHPRQPKAWLSLGHIHKTTGDIPAAIKAYRAAIAQQPGYGEAWFSLANLKTFRFTEADSAAMRTALADAALGDDDRLHLHFALGKALEDDGADDAAFAAYATGAKLRRTQVHHDAARFHDACAARAAMFTAAFFAARASGGCSAADPIFIVGLPRSGSTLIEQILASHSAIEGLAELPHLMSIAGRLGTDPESHLVAVAALSPPERARLGEDYLALARSHRREDKPHFIDKLPNNWLHIALIRLILPKARIIDARRHPLACGWSVFRQHFARGQEFSYDLAEIGTYYRDYAMVMKAHDRAAPGHVHRVIYEHLVADIAGETCAMLGYLGLDFEAACLDFHRNRRAVRTPSAEQVRQPIYRDGLDHWRRFAHHLAPLRDALGPALEDWR